MMEQESVVWDETEWIRSCEILICRERVARGQKEKKKT